MPLVMSEAVDSELVPNGHHLMPAARQDASVESIMRPSKHHPPSTPYHPLQYNNRRPPFPQ